MLCGVQSRVVGYITKSLSFGQQFIRTISVYLFTFIVSHVVIVSLVDKIF